MPADKIINDDVTLILAAGGTGTRTQSHTPKQFHIIANEPLWVYALIPFLKIFRNLSVIIAHSKTYASDIESKLEQLTKEGGYAFSHQLVVGGKTRFHSVRNAVQLLEEHNTYTFVHDAARCFLSAPFLNTLYENAKKNGTAIPYTTPRDSTRVKSDENIVAIDRSTLYQIQTPQVFQTKMLTCAYKQAYIPSFTDDATVVERAGYSLSYVLGSHDNIKVTYPYDLLLASTIGDKC